jgi:diacylglycerol kinase family enzyme
MEVFKTSCIWLTQSLELLTTLTLSSSGLSFDQSSKSILLPPSHIIGCKISESSSRSFNLLFFSESKNKFKTYEFTCTSYQQAQSWCESIEKVLYCNTRHICFIINPLSGNGAGQRVFDKEVIPVLSYSPASYDCFISTHSDFIQDLVQRRDFSVYSDVVCLGGDGTVQQAINAVYSHQRDLLQKISFGVIPVGSRNALACELNGKRLSSSIFNAVRGNQLLGDLMKVSVNGLNLLATCAVSWGVISDAADEAQHLRALGPLRYNLVALKRFFMKWKEYPGVISFEDNLGQMISFTSEYVFTIVANHRVPNLHNSEIVLPNARLNNGKLDVLLMFFTSKCKTLSMFLKMQKNGSHLNSPSVNFIKTRKVKIEPAELRVFNIDGEIHYSSSVEIEVWPGGVHYIGDLKYH